MKNIALAIIIGTISTSAICAESTQAVGKANPASVYCLNQGGTRETVSTPQGEKSYCVLPSGEKIEEWTYFREAMSKTHDQ